MQQGMHRVAIYGSSKMPRTVQKKRIHKLFNYFAQKEPIKENECWAQYYDIHFHYHHQTTLESMQPCHALGVDMIVLLTSHLDTKSLHLLASMPVSIVCLSDGVDDKQCQLLKKHRMHPLVLARHTTAASFVEQLFRMAIYDALKHDQHGHVLALIEQLAHMKFWLEGDLQCIHHQGAIIAKLNLGQDMVRQYVLPDIKQPLAPCQRTFLSLHLACRLGLSEATEYLMMHHAIDQNLMPHIRGNNPLHAAILSQNMAVVRTLMSHQDWFVVWAQDSNDYGLDPLELASLSWPNEAVYDQLLFEMVQISDMAHNPWDVMIHRAIDRMRDMLLARFLLAPYTRRWRQSFGQDKHCQSKQHFEGQQLFADLRAQLRLLGSQLA